MSALRFDTGLYRKERRERSRRHAGMLRYALC
jgi:hypothetical protein